MPEQHTKRILLVEDDVFLAQLLTNRIAKVGVQVLRAADGEEGAGGRCRNAEEAVGVDGERGHC